MTGLLRTAFRAAPVEAVVSIVLTVLMSGQTAALAVLLGRLTTEAAAGRWSPAGVAAVALGLVVAAGLGVTWAAFGVRTVLEEKTLVAVDADLLQRVARLDGLAAFERPDLVDDLAVLRRDRVRFGNLLIVLMTLLGAAVQLLLTVVLLMGLTPVLGVVPVLGVIPLLAGRRAERVRQKAADDAAQADRRAGEWARLGVSPALAAELAVTGMGARVRAHYADADRESAGLLDRGERQAATIVLVGNALFALGYMTAVVVAAVMAMRGDAALGDVVLVAALGARVGGEISLISALASALQAAQAVLRRYRRLMDQAAAGAPGGDAEPPGELPGGIAIRALTFRYPGASADALRDVSLNLAPGETVALVGPNGAGKTTLVKLLCLFYAAPAGTVTVGGRELGSVAVAGWRKRLSAAFQEPVRTAMPVREAVGIGDLERAADDVAVRDAFRRAGVPGLVDGLPRGLDTELGDLSADAVDLSGGQWQQLALARAMMRRQPLLLFLDEPASALDVATETSLLSAYAEARRRAAGSTIGLIVTHRLAAARAADRIVVLAAGRVVEQGTHDELLAAGGAYATMFAAAARGYQE